MIPLIRKNIRLLGIGKKLAPVYWLLSLLFQFSERYGIEL